MTGIDPLPTVDELARRYREEYRITNGEVASPAYFEFMDRRAEAQKEFVFQKFPPNGRPPRVLDIGCSAGSLLLALSERTTSLTGYEPDVNMAETARRRLPSANIVTALCEPDQLQANSFDVITLSHVLEHVIDPVSYLRQLLRILSPNGMVFVEVPHEPLEEVLRIVNARFRSKLHLTYFTPDLLSRCIEAAGARAIKIKTFGPRVCEFSIVPEYLQKLGLVQRARRKATRIAKTLGVLAERHPVDVKSTLNRESGNRGVFIRTLIVPNVRRHRATMISKSKMEIQVN